MAFLLFLLLQWLIITRVCVPRLSQYGIKEDENSVSAGGIAMPVISCCKCV
jgi:hypothetical protein